MPGKSVNKGKIWYIIFSFKNQERHRIYFVLSKIALSCHGYWIETKDGEKRSEIIHGW